MSTLPPPPATHPAATTGHVPADSIGPLPAHLSDIGSPQRLGSPVGSMGGSPYRAGSPVVTTSYVGSPRTNYVPAGSPGASYTGATGPSYDQEVQSYLDQTSPARIREQSQTVLPSSDYMAKAEHESRTNENSPARQRSYHGSPQGSPSGTHYVAPVTTSYVPSGSPHAAPVAYVSSGSPHGGPVTSYVPAAGSPGASYTGATGPSYDQEVQSYLDQTSPARIREQSQTVLPSSDYMAKAEHESRTNENSPTRQRSYHGSPQGSPSGTHYVAPVTTSYVPSGSPSYHSHPVQPTSVVYAPTEHIPLVAGSPAPSYHTATSPVPAAPAQGETHGESPRRLRAFGHPHVDPYAPGNSPQRTHASAY